MAKLANRTTPVAASRSVEPSYSHTEPIAYALLRAWLAITIFTHGYPKLLHLPHSGASDAFVNLVRIIGTTMHLPAATLLAWLITLLETVGAAMLAFGLATRLVALAFVAELVVVAFAVHWPKWDWAEVGMEYPLLLAAVAGYIVVRGGGRFSLDGRLGRPSVQATIQPRSVSDAPSSLPA